MASTFSPKKIKAVILAGGLGTRISEETHLRPKPMIEIGGRPILWHIMKIYSSYGINDFIICAGYRGFMIKEYFANYFLHMSDVTFDMRSNVMDVHVRKAEPWKVTIVDTGVETMTGGRLAQAKPYLNNQTFCLTYGDGVADIDIAESIEFHQRCGKLATLTAVKPPGRYGAIGFCRTDPERIANFQEKPEGDGAWINGGFFVLEPQVLNLLAGGDATVWEREPLEKLAFDEQLAAYRHRGFWRPMDTLRDKIELESLWSDGNAPWNTWS